MKQLFTIIISLAFGILFETALSAQSPETMSYQAVVRDAEDQLFINQPVGMQISILQGSVDGISVYVERHFPTTNANGLVTIVIGTGTVLEGGFAEIDWTSGPYFLKTETDLNGGSNYTIAGTSQLLSVPYALHAKTAESVIGDITETDPAVSANFDFTDAANGDLLQFNGTKWVKVTPDYISDYTVNESDVTAHESAITVTESQISDLGTYIETESDPTVTKYSVGDFAHGGIVFWVDESGQHGLVCSKKDQSTFGVYWNQGINKSSQAKGDGIYAGEANTSLIIAANVALGEHLNTYAARLCNEYKIKEGGTIYGDWYLPSMEELMLMYRHRAAIDATANKNFGSSFASSDYWSSTEYTTTHARYLSFDSGNKNVTSKFGNKLRVRAIRSF